MDVINTEHGEPSSNRNLLGLKPPVAQRTLDEG
jgi:hypothetical protein